MIDLSFLRQLDRFSLIVRKKVTSSYVGERPTTIAGRGLIYKDHAIYTPEEDFKAIDWKVYARTDKFYVKRFEEERNLTVHIIIDTSGSMAFGTKYKKFEYAAMIGLGYAHLALKNNERFVLSTFGEKLDRFKPKKGRKQLMTMVSYLNAKKATGKTRFAGSLVKYEKRIRSKSMIVIISDYLVNLHEVETALVACRGHDVRLVQVLDVVEEDLDPYEGEYKLIDLEEGTQNKYWISPLLKQQYIKQLREHREKLKGMASDNGARFDHFHTGTPVFDAFHTMMLRKA